MESWAFIQQMFAEHLLQAAGGAVCQGGLGRRKMDETGWSLPRSGLLSRENGWADGH